MSVLTKEEQNRLEKILKHPELLRDGYRQEDFERDPYTYRRDRFERATVERGNIRLRLRLDNERLSAYVKVSKHHQGWLFQYDKVEWIEIELNEDHPIWDVVRRLMPQMEAEIKDAVEPPAILEPTSGALSIMPVTIYKVEGQGKVLTGQDAAAIVKRMSNDPFGAPPEKLKPTP